MENINKTLIKKQMQEVKNIIKNKSFDDCFKTLKGHNFNKGYFDFNYKNLCLTLNNKINLIGNVEIYNFNNELYDIKEIGVF